MGCGNGALLLHMRDVIETTTLRGQHLDTHPLMLVGAISIKRPWSPPQTISPKGVKGHFIWGDIGNPDQLALDLMKSTGSVSGT